MRKHRSIASFSSLPQKIKTQAPALNACYEPGLVGAGFTLDRFPFCAVLEPGSAVLYWDASNSSKVAATGLPLVPGATKGNAGNLTLGVVMRAAPGATLSDAATGFNASFFALGLSAESQGMKGTDVALLRRRADAWVLEDRFALAYALPALDAHQTKTLLSAGAVPGAPNLVAWSFSMPLANCLDPLEDAPILPGRDTFVLWAQGAVDPDSGEPQYHGPNRGSTHLPLQSAKTEEAGRDLGQTVVRVD